MLGWPEHRPNGSFARPSPRVDRASKGTVQGGASSEPADTRYRSQPALSAERAGADTSRVETDRREAGIDHSAGVGIEVSAPRAASI